MSVNSSWRLLLLKSFLSWKYQDIIMLWSRREESVYIAARPLQTGKAWEQLSCDRTRGGCRGEVPNYKSMYNKSESKFLTEYSQTHERLGFCLAIERMKTGTLYVHLTFVCLTSFTIGVPRPSLFWDLGMRLIIYLGKVSRLVDYQSLIKLLQM